MARSTDLCCQHTSYSVITTKNQNSSNSSINRFWLFQPCRQKLKDIVPGTWICPASLVSDDNPPGPPALPIAFVVDVSRRPAPGGSVTDTASTKLNVAAKPCRWRSASVASSTVRPCPDDVTVSPLRVPQSTASTTLDWSSPSRTVNLSGLVEQSPPLQINTPTDALSASKPKAIGKR